MDKCYWHSSPFMLTASLLNLLLLDQEYCTRSRYQGHGQVTNKLFRIISFLMTSSYIQRRYKIADSERNAVENARVIWLRRYCRSVGQSLLLNRHLVRVGPCCHALGAISSADSVMVKFGFVIYTYYVYIYIWIRHVTGQAYFCLSDWINHIHIDGLVQERQNSSVLAMELRLSCTNPSTCAFAVL